MLLILGALLALFTVPPIEAVDAPLRSDSTVAVDSLVLRSAPTDEIGLRRMPPDSLVMGRLAIVGGAVGTVIGGLYIYQLNSWWAAEHRGRFHFHDDGGYSQHLDKVGHFHATYFQSRVLARSFRWSGVNHESAALWGALAAWMLQLNVEINDGFSELWGFDVKDVVANTLGAGYFYMTERVPALDAIELKFTYWPSDRIRGKAGRPYEGPLPSPIDDYMGHTYWVSVRVADLLPEPIADVWPGWLALAAGVSGDQLYTPEAQRSYYLALDLDLVRLIPANTWLGAQVREMFNFLKVPAPAIRISPRPTFYPLYYGQP